VIPVFKQDLPTVIDCFERAWEFFSGCPRRVVLDGMKACIDQAVAGELLRESRFYRSSAAQVNWPSLSERIRSQ